MNALKTTFATLILLLLPLWAPAQVKTDGVKARIDNIVELDKTVHDFGDVLTSDGALTCTFTAKNISSKPMVIYNVVSSCGCTGVKWTREPVQPGKTGTITATYTNDEGPYPFDKNLTVYFSGVKKPVILRLRGSAHNKKQPLSELYPQKWGPFAIKNPEIKLGNMNQGSQRSDAANVANIGTKPIRVTFEDVTEGMKIEVSPNPIPSGGTAKMIYTVTASREKWGKNYYYATPLVDGKRYKGDGKRIAVWAFTKEDFSDLSQEEKNKGAQPLFEGSTFSFGRVKAGKKVDAVFSFTNQGKSPFQVYKVDADWARTTADPIPVAGPRQKGSVKVHLDTTGMPEGEALVIVTLTTNSPLRPIVNLFLSGVIE